MHILQILGESVFLAVLYLPRIQAALRDSVIQVILRNVGTLSAIVTDSLKMSIQIMKEKCTYIGEN